MNSTFANLPGHQKMESPGLVLMHASDAAARQIGEAEWVEIYNARGKIRLRARIDGSVPAGVVAASLNWNKLSDRGKQRKRAHLRAAHRPGPRGHVLLNPGGSSKAEPGRSAKTSSLR